MNVSRNFILIGAVYLTLGIVLGSYMGASGNHGPSVAHAHINLLGFTLMTIFGLTYRVFPEMGQTGLAKVHFWLHLVGSIVLLVMLFLLTTEVITEAAMMPLAPISELLVLLGVLVYLWNVFKHVK